MYQKLSPSSVDEQILCYLNNAGFKSPTPLQEKVFPAFFQKKDIIAGVNGARGKRTSFVVPILISLDTHQPRTRSVVITHDPDIVTKISREFKKCRAKNNSDIVIAELVSDRLIKKELSMLSAKPDIIIGTPSRIIDHIRRENIDLSYTETAVVDTPEDPENSGFFQDIDFIFSKMPGKHQKLFYTENEVSAGLIEPLVKKPVIISMDKEHLQEKTQMKSEIDINAEEIEKNVQNMIKKIREDEDPDLLNEYRKLFKKYTPLSMRGYLSAYLLLKSAGVPRGGGSSGRKQSNPDMATLFISVGKNRRVYPRDLARLFQSSLDIPSDDIGAIKVLDSYSFMEISKKQADRAIEGLNGTEYKGKKITVNHARKRRND